MFLGRHISIYPVGLDQADYVVLPYHAEGKSTVYSGAISYLGPENTARLDACLQARMRSDGYDLEHPALMPMYSLAVFKRTGNSMVEPDPGRRMR